MYWWLFGSSILQLGTCQIDIPACVENLVDTGMEHHQGFVAVPSENVGLLTPEIYTALCLGLSDSVGHVVSVDTPIGFALSDWH